MKWLLVLLVACKEDATPCTCKPANVSKVSSNVLTLVRRHRTMVEQHAPGRDVKLVDDEIRMQVTALCQPCGEWVGDRMTIDEMFPLARLDDATGVVCLGLTLRDGTTAFGDRACKS